MAELIFRSIRQITHTDWLIFYDMLNTLFSRTAMFWRKEN